MQFCEPKISDTNVKKIFITQISKGNKIHYATFPENYLAVDDTFLLKNKLSTVQRAVEWVLINEIVCGKMA